MVFCVYREDINMTGMQARHLELPSINMVLTPLAFPPPNLHLPPSVPCSFTPALPPPPLPPTRPSPHSPVLGGRCQS